MKKLIFWFNLFFVITIAVGAMPRQFSFILLAVYLGYVIFAKIDSALLLFAASIPFFIALPITPSFDNFNIWRLVLAVIFIKWAIYNIPFKNKLSFSQIWAYLKNNRIEALALALGIIGTISAFWSPYTMAALKRVIYFANIGVLFLITKDLVAKHEGLTLKLLKYFLLGGLMLTTIGFLQLVTAFYLPFWDFHYFWAKTVMLGLYGTDWSNIAEKANTWYSYSGGGLMLRMFSTFPDSHSFPIYLIFSMTALFTLFYETLSEKVRQSATTIKQIARANKPIFKKYFLLFLLLALATILSQTRGVWLAIIVPLAVSLYLIKKGYKTIENKLLASSFIIFAGIFIFTFAFSYIPQFRLGSQTGGGSFFLKRIISTINPDETSNFGRVEIWKATLKSIVKHPLLGVGIGNYPLVLKQDEHQSKAGSSAHNLYLTVIAEIGILGGILFVWFLYEPIRQALILYKKHKNIVIQIFGFFTVIMILWIYAYSMTDAVLFDERTFLATMLFFGMVSGEFKRI